LFLRYYERLAENWLDIFPCFTAKTVVVYVQCGVALIDVELRCALLTNCMHYTNV
jgi:hypothetical protein